jgi:predicted transcriptional regulator
MIYIALQQNKLIMEPECRRITKELVPAVRAYIIDLMSSRYRYTQKEIAGRLGIAQVAVSKYLNGRYSDEVARLKAVVGREMDAQTIRVIMRSRNAADTEREIERFCERFINA